MTRAHLQALESQSIYILREAAARMNNLAMLWSMGKDSTVMLWLAKKAFFGCVPFPLLLLDTGMEMDEVYAFRDQLTRAWDLNLLSVDCPALESIDKTLPPATRAAMRKTDGLRAAIEEHGYQGIFCGIRRDEQGLRAKERVFSPRGVDSAWHFKDQPPELWGHYNTHVPEGGHMRIHPLLNWREIDVWQYIAQENIPVCDLYFSNDGKRYRSLGEKNITLPIESSAATIDEIIAELQSTRVAERSGRLMDAESEASFETLRSRGYM